MFTLCAFKIEKKPKQTGVDETWIIPFKHCSHSFNDGTFFRKGRETEKENIILVCVCLLNVPIVVKCGRMMKKKYGHTRHECIILPVAHKTF